MKHDDGVKDIAFSAENVSQLFNKCIENGAKPILEPTEFNDGASKIIKASISAFGDTIHSFIEKQNNSDILPFYVPTPSLFGKTVGLEAIDHFAIAVEKNTLEQWTDFYKSIFGFHVFYSENIYTGNSGMKSVVVCNKAENIKFVMMEGISSTERSQIESYIDNYGGTGVQHIAFLSDDIIKTTYYLKKQGISFLDIPQNYYKNLQVTLDSKMKREVQIIMELGILFDEDKKSGGYLMQIFSKPLQNKPTFFMEIIQREKANGFGSGNIKALYDAVQQEQEKKEIIC